MIQVWMTAELVTFHKASGNIPKHHWLTWNIYNFRCSDNFISRCQVLRMKAYGKFPFFMSWFRPGLWPEQFLQNSITVKKKKILMATIRRTRQARQAVIERWPTAEHVIAAVKSTIGLITSELLMPPICRSDAVLFIFGWVEQQKNHQGTTPLI